MGANGWFAEKVLEQIVYTRPRERIRISAVIQERIHENSHFE